MPGGHGDVVEQAETHRAVGHGMMARRANQAQALGVFAAYHPLDGIAHAARRLQRDVVAARADDRVGFDVAAAGLGVGPNLVDVGRGMHAGEMLTRDGRELRLATPGGQARLPQTLRNPSDPLGTLRSSPVSWSRKQGGQYKRVILQPLADRLSIYRRRGFANRGRREGRQARRSVVATPVHCSYDRGCLTPEACPGSSRL